MESLDLSIHFATPVIWCPTSEDAGVEIEQMMNRSVATSQWVSGEIDTETFLDCLDENGIDVPTVWDDWENGISYLV